MPALRTALGCLSLVLLQPAVDDQFPRADVGFALDVEAAQVELSYVFVALVGMRERHFCKAHAGVMLWSSRRLLCTFTYLLPGTAMVVVACRQSATQRLAWPLTHTALGVLRTNKLTFRP